jgi:hypothetical protein
LALHWAERLVEKRAGWMACSSVERMGYSLVEL